MVRRRGFLFEFSGYSVCVDASLDLVELFTRNCRCHLDLTNVGGQVYLLFIKLVLFLDWLVG